MSKNKYEEDGVNVAEGDDFSAMAGNVCKNTFNNSPFVEVKDFSRGHFRGPRGFHLKNIPNGAYMDIAPDGMGTKVMVIDAASAHRYACRDLIAMTSSDIIRWGGLPLVFVNILDVKTLGASYSTINIQFQIMMEGLEEVAKEQNIVCFRGETAELGPCVGTTFNWSGIMLGIYHPDRMITGDSLKEGQTVVTLREYGFRSNGLSSARAALKMHFGNNWMNNSRAISTAIAVAKPSVLYDNLITALNGWNDYKNGPFVKIHSISHISGGGIVSKFAEDILFPRGLSANLDSLFPPPEIMREIAEWRGMTDEECYKTFNCGNGMLVVVDDCDAEYIIASAKEKKIEARICGKITKNEEPLLTISSQFSGQKLKYTPKP